MNHTIKNAVRTMLIHSGAPANLRAECLYAICKVRNRVVRAGRSMASQEIDTRVEPTDVYVYFAPFFTVSIVS